MVQETKEISQSQDTPPKVGQSSEEEVTPKTYSEAEFLKAVSDEKTISGRLKTDLGKAVKERDDFKFQAEQAKGEVEEARAEKEKTEAAIDELKADMETLEDENASAADISKIRKRLLAAEEKHKVDSKAERAAIAEEKKLAREEREANAELVADAQAATFKTDVIEVSGEYVDGEGNGIKPEKLKALCEKAAVTKREDIEGLADVLWAKKETEGTPVLVPDSSITSGGGSDLDKLSSRDLLRKAYSQKKGKVK